MTPTEVRLTLLKGDYDPIPLRGKNPGLMKKWAWQKIGHANAEQVDLWARSFPDATNTGVLTLRAPTLDIDIQDSGAAGGGGDVGAGSLRRSWPRAHAHWQGTQAGDSISRGRTIRQDHAQAE